jgi:hypothetical protein
MPKKNPLFKGGFFSGKIHETTLLRKQSRKYRQIYFFLFSIVSLLEKYRIRAMALIIKKKNSKPISMFVKVISPL